MARSNTGNKGFNQQLVTVTPNTWTDLLPRDTNERRVNQNLRGLTINKLVIQNTGTDDITVSVKFISRDPQSPHDEYEGEVISDKIISGSHRRGSNGTTTANNLINFSKPMGRGVEGYGFGGHDANTIADWNGLTYTGVLEMDFVNYQLQFPNMQSVQFKANVGSGFIATLIMNDNQIKMKQTVGGNGIKM